MPKWPLLLVAAGSVAVCVPAVAQPAPAAASSGLSVTRLTGPHDSIVFVGGMSGGTTGGGMTGGGMPGGGMTGGGMTGGGMTGGGMTGGGMTGGMAGGMTGGMPGGGMMGTGVTPGYGATPGYAAGSQQPYATTDTGGAGAQSARSYICLTHSGHCAVDAAAGPLRRGSACHCLFGGQGKIQ